MIKKHRYNISNLDCANCASRIESELKKKPDLKNVIVNFSTSKISYEADETFGLKEITKLVRKIEPAARITDNVEVKKTKEYRLSLLIIGTLIGILGMYIKMPMILSKILVSSAYLLLLYKPFINALKLLIKSKTINENALITISCVGAYLVNQEMEGIMVVFLYLIGKILEEKALNKTRNSIKNLLDIKQDYANKKTSRGLIKIDVNDILINDVLVVKKGERVPVDGIILKGSTKLDMSALTGESELVLVEKGTNVLSGSINNGEIIEMKATSIFKDSAVSKIIELVEEATDKKANMETFVSKASKIYTPLVLFISILIAVLLPLFFKINYTESIYRGLTFLVVSCPCAIAISVPLSYFTGIGISSKNGILVKGSNYLDNLSHLNKIIFDKTGTLTTGTFRVKDIRIFDDKYTKDQVITILVKGESLSNHPIAKSIMKLTDKRISNKDVSNYQEVEGEGILFTLNHQKIKIGTAKICECDEETDVHLNIEGKHVASIEIDDGIKESAFESINILKKLKIEPYMFTGDKKNIAKEIGKLLGIDAIKYEMLPTDKYHQYELVKKKDDTIAFVGDGINDAPILKRADIGISMGNLGSAIAIEASDVVIMTDDLMKIPQAISISKYTNYIIKQNLIFAISIKFIILILSIFGLTTMWLAVFADTGVTLLTILNTLRIMKKYN